MNINVQKILPNIFLAFWIIMLIISYFYLPLNPKYKLGFLFLICFLIGIFIEFIIKAYFCHSYQECLQRFFPQNKKDISQKRYLKKIKTLIQNINKEDILKKIPKIESLDISAINISNKDISGDCYDVIPLNENETLIYLGDASSPQITPNMLIHVTNLLIISLLKKEITLKKLIIKLNKIITDKTTNNVFITAVFSIRDKKRNILTIVQAGHEEVLHFNTTKKEVIKTKKGGIAIANPLFNKKNIKKWHINLFEQKIKLSADDYLLYYSDGIIDATNKNNDFYGKKRLMESFQEACLTNNKASEIKEKILKDLFIFNNNKNPNDDTTLLVIKIR